MKQSEFLNQLFANKKISNNKNGDPMGRHFYLKFFEVYLLLRIFVVENPSTKGIAMAFPPDAFTSLEPTM